MPLQRFQADLTDYQTYRSRVGYGIDATASVIAFQPFLGADLSVIDGDQQPGKPGRGRSDGSLGKAS